MKLVALVVSVAAFFVALMQFILAREKFKADLFEKRLKVLQELEKHLTEIVSKNDYTSTMMQKLYDDTISVNYLFGDDIVSLMNELDTNGRQLHYIKERLREKDGHDNDAVVGDERKKMSKERDRITTWFMDTHKNIRETFSPYLKLKNWQSPFMWE